MTPPAPRLWAPRADAVELVLADRVVPMVAEERGWWRAEGDLPAGTRYAFRLDGGPERPDPRSASQPDGIEGWSAVVDHDDFEWHDAGWRGVPLLGAVLYELHVGTFTPAGTFDAAAERLPHLLDLGVDAVELLPVAEFPGERGWGYDGVLLYAAHHAYGGPDGLKRFVEAAHQVGIGVVLDVVYNHLGPEGNHLDEFGPYFTDRYTTAWGRAMNFDGPGSDDVRRFVVDNALHWMRDFHIDGLRLDAVHAIIDTSATHIMEQLSVEVQALAAATARHRVLIAESDRNDPRFVRSRDVGGHGLDAAWADDWHHAVHATLTDERDGYYGDFGPLPLLAKALRQAWVHDGNWSAFRRRTHGRSPAGLEAHRFVVSIQNHDQVGNRAQGDRLVALTGEGRHRVAAALLLTAPFVPMLFQGEEWGTHTPFLYFTDVADPELAVAVREGRREEFAAFGWDPKAVPDPQKLSTFERSRLDWDELEHPASARMLAWYRELIALRRRVPALTDPNLDRVAVTVDEDAGSLVIDRGEGVRIACNLGPAALELDVADDTEVLAASDAAIELENGRLRLPPDTLAVYTTNTTP